MCIFYTPYIFRTYHNYLEMVGCGARILLQNRNFAFYVVIFVVESNFFRESRAKNFIYDQKGWFIFVEKVGNW